jgi:hypothetical protein
MPDGGGLARLVDASAVLSAEQQAAIAARHGEDRWALDTAAATVTLTAPDGRTLVCRAHLLGTSAPGPGTWLWGWRNINDFPPAFVELAQRVRTAGEEQDLPELTTAEIRLTDELPRRLTVAAKALTGLAAHYSERIGGGSRAWLLIEHPDLELAAPSAQRTMEAIVTALDHSEIEDHPAALASWARQRDVPITEGPDGRSRRLTLPDGDVLVTLDDRQRIARVEATARVGLDAAAERRSPAPEPEPLTEGPVTGAAPGQQAEQQPGTPESPMRRLLGFLRGPKP